MNLKTHTSIGNQITELGKHRPLKGPDVGPGARNI
jgi:hypothetical protein